MDTEKIILEMYGKVSETASDVKHLVERQDMFEKKVETLHERVDNHGKWINGMKAVIAFVTAIGTYIFFWFKSKIGH